MYRYTYIYISILAVRKISGGLSITIPNPLSSPTGEFWGASGEGEPSEYPNVVIILSEAML